MTSFLLVTIWSLFALYGIKKLNYISINILVLMCVFQNFILIIASSSLSKEGFNLFIMVKEAYVVLLIVNGLIKYRQISRFQFGCIICTIMIVAYGFIHGSSSMTGLLASIRQLYLPFIFYILGSVCLKDSVQIRKVLLFFVKLMVVSAVFGWIEMAIGANFWLKLGYRSFAALKGTETGLSPEGVHGAFYSWDLGVRLRRMASFLAEPVILGQLFAFALIVSIFIKGIFKSKLLKAVAVIILALALLSTLAKGGIIIALFAFTFALGEIWHQRELSFWTRCAFVLILIGGVGYVICSGTNGVMHMAGLIDNLRCLFFYPFGRGVGTVGNLGYNYGGRTELLASGESFIGAAIGQMGFFAIVLYTYFYKKLFTTLSKASQGKFYNVSRVSLWLNVGLLITSLVNNTAISFTSCFIFYIVAGSVYSAHKYDKILTLNNKLKDIIYEKKYWNNNIS